MCVIINFKHKLTNKYMLEITKGAIKNGQSRETGNIGEGKIQKTRTKTQHNISSCVHLYYDIKIISPCTCIT